MEHQRLGPGVEDGKESDFGAESFWIGRDLDEGVGDGAEQEVVERLGIGADQSVQFVWEREDHVKVRNRQ